MNENQITPDGTVYYRHFKGNPYKVLYIATHTETLEKLVVYQALYGEFGIWARPYDMFFGYVDRGSGPVRRFEPVFDKEL